MNTQLENLYFLRDTVIPWMREHQEQVDFGTYECGSYKCFAEWACHFDNEGRFPSPSDLHCPNVRGIASPIGAPMEIHWGLFNSDSGTLDDREAVLIEFIARKEKELGKSLVVYRSGADIVKDLLKEKVA